jgi:vesicle coat complex subunit
LREHITHEHGSESALQECVIVACRILRKYPKKFDTLIKDIIDQMRRIDEPESKSAFIWILGEYSDKIEGAEEKLQFFVDSFSDEATHVCLQILTAAVKMYIRNPDENEEMVMHVLKLASEESDNPDLRDRGYIYWRMLHTDPTRTKEVVLTKRPSYNEDLTNLMDEETREIFISVGIPKFKSKKATEGEVAPEPKQLSDDEEEPEAEGEHVEKEVKPKKEKKRKNKRNKDEEEKKQIDVEEISIPEEKPKSLIDDLFNFDSPEDSSQQPSDLNIDPLAEIFGSSSNGIQDGSSSGLGGLDSGVFGSFETPISSFIKPKPTEVLNSSIVGSSGINKGLQIQG